MGVTGDLPRLGPPIGVYMGLVVFFHWGFGYGLGCEEG